MTSQKLPPRPSSSQVSDPNTHAARTNSRVAKLMNRDSSGLGDLSDDEADTLIAGRQSDLPEEVDQYMYSRF